MKKTLIVLSVAVSTLLLSGCGAETKEVGILDKDIQPHKVKRTINPTTIGDMTLAVKNSTNSYIFSFSLADTSKHSQIYIDTDRKRDTGFTPWDEGGVGAEYLMEDGNLFRYKGAGGDDFDDNWELVSWGEDDITSRDISFETLGDLDEFNVQGVLLDSDWEWDSSSDVQEFVRSGVDKPTPPDNVGKQVTRAELDEMIANGEDYSQVDVSQITDMSGLFRNKEVKFDITGWDVSNVTNMSGMFSGSKLFNQLIGSWDVSNVKDMAYMFAFAESFNQPIGDWDVSNVSIMRGMFSDARKFNQPIGNWDVSSVTDMYRMFDDAILFNQPLINWNVSSVINMDEMFYNAHNFNQNISLWNVSGLKSYPAYFSYHSALLKNYSPDFTIILPL